jgi:hypothetical protein
MRKKFSISEALLFGFSAVKKRPLFYILIPLIPMLIGFATSVANTMIGAIVSAISASDIASVIQTALVIIVQIVSWIISTLFSMGITAAFLAAAKNEELQVKDLLKYKYAFIPYFIANVVVSFVSVFAFLLLIVPGVLWMLATQFYQYEVLTQGIGPFAAIKKSLAITNGAKMRLFLFAIAAGLVNLVGALLFVVGLLVTLPATSIAMAYVYIKLKEQTEGKTPVVEVIPTTETV